MDCISSSIYQYMTNVQAASSEAKKMAVAYGNIGDREIVFKIPIFENMPSWFT